MSRRGKGGGRRHENNKIYAYPLPIIFPERPISILRLLGLSLTQTERPACEGYLDVATKSVWILNRPDSLLLWQRGFFGKGDLSRSEPSWLARQLKKRSNKLTSEEIREKRRAERKQFKLDRAKAIATLAAEAEAVFEAEGRVIVPPISGPEIPSGATWKPAPQETLDPPLEEILDEEVPLEDVEHLQLTFQEAFFLIWNFDCLTIIDPHANEAMSLEQLWITFQNVHLPPTFPLQPDNRFLIHYAVYHHYRSLGWVVKGGIKFCVDYLLYKRGPVFAHAEFAVVVCPVYEDPSDQESHDSTPFSWSWLSTINRVNTQVLKTLLLTYVTIPAKGRVDLSSPSCLAHYGIKEVVVRRFIPARMRD